MKKLVVFDLDGTLAPSKSAIDDEMSALLYSLLQVARVAIISGGAWPQFEKQVLAHLPIGDRLQQLSVLPTCGTQFYEYDNEWRLLYAENFTAAEKEKIVTALSNVVVELGYKPQQLWGEQIEDRGSQITFSALGQQAPLAEKQKWDPDFAKRQKMKALLAQLIPEFSVNLGGTTSVDITKPGIDKAYGIHKLKDILHIAIAEMLFAGDAIFPGGNDYPAQEAGVDCIRVRDPEETKRVIATIVACYTDL
ncbi:MAG: HAD-IIB family hydrolase [Chitinophaga sp.]|uniref:HAD-IIB family hydrolase n=1 Tax=Chitinophaga sp. TaxID=1869181 RepID=UPI001AFDACA2|nr:HAD-IIB family hydrolase [Chitinophaga sp.]MBO9731041.1 HAD-IIB family hydrolase [Chitinophaga sp.]